MTLTLLGDVVLGTFLTLVADRIGRRKVLIGGSLLMVLSGIIFAVFENFWILLLAAIVGVISITGGDFGPFRSIEELVVISRRRGIWLIDIQVDAVTADYTSNKSRCASLVCHNSTLWVIYRERVIRQSPSLPSKQGQLVGD